MPKTFVEVFLDQNLAKHLDYSVPDEWTAHVQPGMRVEIPLKGTLKRGTIAKVKTNSTVSNVRSITRVLSEETELSPSQWKLAHWMAHYYATPLQRVLKCFIPPNLRKGVKAQSRILISLCITHEEGLKACEVLRSQSPHEAMVLEALLNRKKGCFASDLIKELQISRNTIDQLVKKKIISAKKAPHQKDLLLEEEFFLTPPKRLNEQQTTCLEAIDRTIRSSQFAAHLIHGVTGSGKTEIYLRAIQAALEQNKGAILLVPEVSLTSQTIERFRSRFPDELAILHHKRSFGERTHAWERLRKGEVHIAIGARSAIFAPMPRLGLIIVDEEHDHSYKQSDEIPCYHARNVAVMRAHLECATILLGSATPSVESFYNTEIGKYQLHTLAARAGGAPMPIVQMVDMKRAFDINGGFTHFSTELLDGIKERLDAGEQTLLFLNRRGYHRLQLCAACRNTIKCPHCDLNLIFHREANLLRCHLCNFQQLSPRQCPECGATESLQFKGFGTEHVERSLHAIFPDLRTLRMDRDTTQRKESHEEIFKQFRSHKADVLIGTQMIAKGFHFPSVTLVGVLNADAALSVPDFRAPESVFQLLTQVAGRAGREELPGKVILQTFMPNHPILKFAQDHDYASFYKAEIEERRLFGFPPFAHLIKCLFSSPSLDSAKQSAELAHSHLSSTIPLPTQIFPVTPSGHAKMKDLYRFQFLIKTPKIDFIIPFLQSTPPMKAHLKIDIDPLSTFF